MTNQKNKTINTKLKREILRAKRLGVLCGQAGIEMTNKNKEIGLRVKALRTSAGYSQEELVELLSFSTAPLSCMERGLTKKPDRFKLQELADVFNVDVDYIINGTAIEAKKKRTLCERVSLFFASCNKRLDDIDKRIWGGK